MDSIEKDIYLEGLLVLAPACRIGSGAHVAGSVLWGGVIVDNGARVQDAILGTDVRIGEGAQVEAGSVLVSRPVVAADALSVLRKQMSVLFLYSSRFPQCIPTGYAAKDELLPAHDIPVETVHARGAIPLAHVLTTVFYGDWVSFYLAVGYDINPTLIGPINTLKERLARG